MKTPIKVLVVDDHPLVRKGLTLCLSCRKDMKIVGETGDAREVIGLARELRPHVILMDIDMPHVSGLAVTRLLGDKLPEVKVLILSIHENPEYIRQAIQAGARGYIFKGASAADFASAVEAVYRGEVYFTPEMVRLTLSSPGCENINGKRFQLTSREQEVLVQIAEGSSNREIAGRLGVSERTVEFHRGQLKSKLNLHSAASLTRFAVAQGWVPAAPMEMEASTLQEVPA